MKHAAMVSPNNTTLPKPPMPPSFSPFPPPKSPRAAVAITSLAHLANDASTRFAAIYAAAISPPVLPNEAKTADASIAIIIPAGSSSGSSRSSSSASWTLPPPASCIPASPADSNSRLPHPNSTPACASPSPTIATTSSSSTAVQLSPMATHIEARIQRSLDASARNRPDAALADIVFAVESLQQTPDPHAVRVRLAINAVRALRKLAQHDTDAAFILGHVLEHGIEGCKSDPFKPLLAEAYASYLTASKRGHIEGTFRVAIMCLAGSGTTASKSKALQYLRKAAIKHHPAAMRLLGISLLHGNFGDDPRPRDGAMWLRMASHHATPQHPEALYDLAQLHISGHPSAGIYRDESFAADLITRAAEYGHCESIFCLAVAHEFGLLGLPKDAAKAFDGYYRVATLGHPEAMFEVSGWYLTADTNPTTSSQGLVIVQSDAKAFDWMIKAAQTGFPKAVYGIGYLIHHGIGVERDLAVAASWYSRAVELGETNAAEKLAQIKSATLSMSATSYETDSDESAVSTDTGSVATASTMVSLTTHRSESRDSVTSSSSTNTVASSPHKRTAHRFSFMPKIRSAFNLRLTPIETNTITSSPMTSSPLDLSSKLAIEILAVDAVQPKPETTRNSKSRRFSLFPTKSDPTTTNLNSLANAVSDQKNQQQVDVDALRVKTQCGGGSMPSSLPSLARFRIKPHRISRRGDSCIIS